MFNWYNLASIVWSLTKGWEKYFDLPGGYFIDEETMLYSLSADELLKKEGGAGINPTLPKDEQKQLSHLRSLTILSESRIRQDADYATCNTTTAWLGSDKPNILVINSSRCW